MDDLSKKLSEFLSTPGAMDQVKNMAEMLGAGGGSNDQSEYSDEQENEGGEENFNSPFDNPETLLKIKTIMDKLNDNKDDKRINLLLALKPYLNEKREGTLDKSIKILKVTKVMPLLTKFFE